MPAHSKGIGQYPARTGAQESVECQFWFTGVNGSDPTDLTEPTGQNFITSVTRDGEGSWLVAFRHDWADIRPVGPCAVTGFGTTNHAHVATIDLTAGAQTVGIQAYTSNGTTAADLPGEIIICTLKLYRR